MGRLAGVGDPLVRQRCALITAALVHLEHFLDLRPASFFFIHNAVRLAMKWDGLQLGFRKG
ncbi:hypothetical protein ACNKHW_25775 [Shigella flexneri]